MKLKEIIEYYSREDVQKALLGLAEGREVVGVFKNGNYGKRPNTIIYPQDIITMVRSGMIEFHSSIERWSQPMAIKEGNYDSLRTGWDIVFDLDCRATEHGKEAAKAFIWGLKKHGIRNFSVKFTGGRGFHIGIPWESVPSKIDYRPSPALFPDVPRKICSYLKEYVREEFEKLLLKRWRPEEIAKQINRPLKSILTEEGIDPYQVVDVDSVLISPRHLFRMPYSLNKKTWLVSLPLRPGNIDEFDREHARPERIKAEIGFLDSAEQDEAELLIAEALDWWSARNAMEEMKRKAKILEVKTAVKEEFFPPCIKNILKGLSDGKKRSVFVLLNFLSSLKWKWDDIETLLLEWNNKNTPPLRENYIRSHIRWHKSRDKPLPPPGCKKEGWYMDCGVCSPDNLCGGQEKTIKNPVRYPFRKMGYGKGADKKVKRNKLKS